MQVRKGSMELKINVILRFFQSVFYSRLAQQQQQPQLLAVDFNNDDDGRQPKTEKKLFNIQRTLVVYPEIESKSH